VLGARRCNTAANAQVAVLRKKARPAAEDPVYSRCYTDKAGVPPRRVIGRSEGLPGFGGTKYSQATQMMASIPRNPAPTASQACLCCATPSHANTTPVATARQASAMATLVSLDVAAMFPLLRCRTKGDQRPARSITDLPDCQ
jgi:hypothetical protein